MENLQERLYKSKINMLIKQGGLQIIHIIPHYSNPAIGMRVMVHNVTGHTQAFSVCLIRLIMQLPMWVRNEHQAYILK